MFKEIFAGFLALCILWFCFRLLYKKSEKVAAWAVTGLLVLFCAANIIYNSLNIFPDFYMDIINGRFRYGTFSENLFAYSDEFMFQDEILFPVLRNRHVSLDDSAEFYEKFFNLYAASTNSIAVTESQRDSVITHLDEFAFSHEFSCIGIMDYAKDFLPPELEPAFEEEAYPMVYIHTESLRGQKKLVAVMDTDYTLCLMSEDYYDTITGGNNNA